METKNQKLLDEEIENSIQDLGHLNLGSEEYAIAVKNLETLYMLRANEEKMVTETELKKQELDFKKKESKVHSGLQVAQLIVGVGDVIYRVTCYANWIREGFKFEEKGVLTSRTFMGYFPKANPKNI